MNFTKIVKADLDSPRRELSNGGLEIVAALTVFSGNYFFPVFLLGVQSSCRELQFPKHGLNLASLRQILMGFV